MLDVLQVIQVFVEFFVLFLNNFKIVKIIFIFELYFDFSYSLFIFDLGYLFGIILNYFRYDFKNLLISKRNNMNEVYFFS